MLSATIGMVTVDFEAATVTIVAIWESPRPLAPPPLAFDATNGFDSAPWEHLPDRNSLGVLWNGPGNVGNLDLRPPLGLSGGNVSGGVQTGGTGGLVDVDTYALDPKDRPLAGQADNPANANIGPGGPTKIVTSGNETNGAPPLPGTL